MARIFISILFLLSTLISFGQGEAVFSFEQEEIKFGKAKGGDVLNFSYPFTNTGSTALIIDKISVACSCTQPEWPKRPIMPGEKDSITVVFDTKTVWGYQEKELRIYSNAGKGAYTSLTFKGSVKKGDYVKEEQKK